MLSYTALLLCPAYQKPHLHPDIRLSTFLKVGKVNSINPRSALCQAWHFLVGSDLVRV